MNKKAISKNYIDENKVRLVAAQVVIVTVVILYTGWLWLALLLTLDFALRAFTRFPSLLSLIAKTVANLLKLKAKPIFAPPKRFAALIGFLFSAGISAFLFSNLLTGAFIAGGILAFCAMLEALFNVCLGCYVYNWVVAPFVNVKGA